MAHRAAPDPPIRADRRGLAVKATQTCSAGGCGRTGKMVRGLCSKHYARWKRQGGLDRPCSIDGCDQQLSTRGLCHKHYARLLAHGTTADPAPRPTACSIDGCDAEYYTAGFCHPHYRAKRNYGDPLAAPGYASGERSVRWKGAQAGYHAVHDRLRSRRGKASDYTCVECGGKARDWAYDYKCPDEAVWVERNLVYSHDVDRYEPLCTPCHRRRDRAHRPLSPVRTCSAEGCDGRHDARGFCARHYYQAHRRGIE